MPSWLCGALTMVLADGVDLLLERGQRVDVRFGPVTRRLLRTFARLDPRPDLVLRLLEQALGRVPRVHCRSDRVAVVELHALENREQVVEVLDGCVRRVDRVHVVRPLDAIHGSRNGLEVPEHPRDVGLLAHCELLGDRPQRGDHHRPRALLVSLREIDLLDRRGGGLDGPWWFRVAGDGPRSDRTGGDQVRERAIADRRRDHPGSGLGLDTPCRVEHILGSALRLATHAATLQPRRDFVQVACRRSESARAS